MALEVPKYLVELETEIKSIKETEETNLRFQQLDEKINKLEVVIKMLSLQAELSSTTSQN